MTEAFTLSPPAAAAEPASEDLSADALADRLRALAHPARLAVLARLSREEACVCGEIVRGLPLAQSTVSQHLKVLAEAGLIRSRAEGPRTLYCINRTALLDLRRDLDAVFAALLPASDCCGSSDHS